MFAATTVEARVSSGGGGGWLGGVVVRGKKEAAGWIAIAVAQC